MQDQTVPAEVLPSCPPPTPQRSFLFPVLIITVIMSLIGVASFFGYQYFQLKKQLTTATPTPAALPASAPTSASAPNPTSISADWKTYQNDDYKLTFKYPANFTLEDRNPVTHESGHYIISVMSPLKPKGEKYTGVTGQELKMEIYINPSPKDDSLDRFYAEQMKIDEESSKTLKKTIVNIAGVAAIRREWEGYGSGVTYVLINNQNRLLITKYPLQSELDNTFNQILSTVKFNSAAANPANEKEAITRTLREVMAQKTGYPIEKVKITSIDIEGNFAKGSNQYIVEGNEGPGAGFIAAKINSQWIVVEEFQEPPSCKLMNQYNIPKSFYGDCIEK